MPSTAQISIRSTVVGLPEGGTDNFLITLTNSSAVGTLVTVTAATALSAAATVAVPSSGKYMIITPPSTNTLPIYVGMTTGGTNAGVQLSSVDASLLSVVGGSTMFMWTTGATAVSGVRVAIY